MKTIIRSIIVLLFLSYLTWGDSTVSLGWCPSPSAGVTGYYVAYGSGQNITNWSPSVYSHPSTNPCPGILVSAGSNWFLAYTNRIDVGNTTAATVSNLVAGVTYYFSVIAYSAYGDEAPPSNEIKYTPPLSATLKRPSSLSATSP